MVEHHLAKVRVAGSSPVSRLNYLRNEADDNIYGKTVKLIKSKAEDQS